LSFRQYQHISIWASEKFWQLCYDAAQQQWFLPRVLSGEHAEHVEEPKKVGWNLGVILQFAAAAANYGPNLFDLDQTSYARH
jgi:hypothetical protein